MSHPASCPQELYLSWVVEARRHILAILQDYPSLRPPIDHLCELLPRLQARYYSIASSSKVGRGGSAHYRKRSPGFSELHGMPEHPPTPSQTSWAGHSGPRALYLTG